MAISKRQEWPSSKTHGAARPADYSPDRFPRTVPARSTASMSLPPEEWRDIAGPTVLISLWGIGRGSARAPDAGRALSRRSTLRLCHARPLGSSLAPVLENTHAHQGRPSRALRPGTARPLAFHPNEKSSSAALLPQTIGAATAVFLERRTL